MLQAQSCSKIRDVTFGVSAIDTMCLVVRGVRLLVIALESSFLTACNKVYQHTFHTKALIPFNENVAKAREFSHGGPQFKNIQPFRIPWNVAANVAKAREFSHGGP